MISQLGMKIFIYGVIVIIAAAIVAGFFIVGSPFEERIRRFDDRRVQDLQNIQSEIINYWTSKESLPNTLSDIRDDIRGIVIPKDPETGGEYEYIIRGNLTFALCATFSRASESMNSSTPKPVRDPYYTGENWEHSEGRVCFERTIDPDIYRPKTKTPTSD